MADHSDPHNPMSRRTFLRLMGGAATPLILVACGAPVAQTPTTAPAVPTSAPTAAATSAPGAVATSAPQATVASGSARGGTLRVAFTNPEANFNNLTMESAQVFINIYEPLAWVDAQWNLQPRLATAWEPSEGGKVWTFKLREGVTFHHGTPFTAADVVHTVKRLKDPTLGKRYANNVAIIDTVEAVDDRTVRFKLTAPYAVLPAITSGVFLYVLPHDQTEDDYAKRPMGTGPFRFKENVAGERTVLVRNEKYWDATLPFLDEIQINYMSDPNTQVAALIGGTVDVLPSIRPVNVPTLEAAGQITINEIKSGAAEVLVMRVDQKPFDDPRVRQAFKLVVDREGMIKAVLQGHGVVGNDQIIPPSNPYWANVPAPPYDVAKAKALLTEAGYAKGLDVTLYVSDAVAPNSAALGVAFKEMAKAAGINVTVEQVTPEAYYAKYYMQTAFFVDYWYETVHPDNTLNFSFRSDGSYNASGWKSQKLDQLIDTARTELDPAKQKALYGDIQKLISEEGATIAPYFRNLLTATRDIVRGVEFSPRSFVLFREASIKKP